jgi:hypothetical protein
MTEPLSFSCPSWCRYQCREDWKTGHCLVLRPEKTREYMNAYKASGGDTGQ